MEIWKKMWVGVFFLNTVYLNTFWEVKNWNCIFVKHQRNQTLQAFEGGNPYNVTESVLILTITILKTGDFEKYCRNVFVYMVQK